MHEWHPVGRVSPVGLVAWLAMISLAGCSSPEDELAADAPPPADTSAPPVDEAVADLEEAVPGLGEAIAGLEGQAPGLGDALSGLGGAASGLDEALSGIEVVAPGIDTAAGDIPQGPAGSDPTCCSCAFTAGKTYSDPRLPCVFDFPEPWAATAGGDGTMISAVAGPPPQSCANTICPKASPAMSVSYGKTYDSNADTMLEIWPMAMPGGWLRLRDMFIDSFRDNPGSTFPDG